MIRALACTMKQLHVKNHYVPECYLKRWADSKGRVWVYRTLVSHPNVPIWRRHSVSAIAYQRHLYTQILSGSESDSMESWFAEEFESPANEILEKAIFESRLTSHDWHILIKFLAAQDVRTPARLLEHLRRAQKELPELLEGVMRDLKRKLDRGDMDNLQIQRNMPHEDFPLKITTRIEEGAETGILKAETYAGRATWIHSVKHLLNHTRRVLNEHNWTIIKPAKGYYWPTSDNPVVKLNYYAPGKYDLRGGWGVKKGNIFFPIGPEHAMFVQIGDRPISKYSRVSEHLTIKLISFASENAHRQIFSHLKNGNIPEIRIRAIDPEKLTRENKEFSDWNKLNSEMELEYLVGNRST